MVTILTLLAAMTATSCGAGSPTAGSAATRATPAGSSSASTGTPLGSQTGERPTLSADRRYVFPVRADASFGSHHHDYPATDIFAACGSPVVAPTSGTIVEVSTKDVWSPTVNAGATRGGLSFALVGDDGVRYYGSHLSALDAGTVPGRQLAVGAPIGRVGHTGDARGIACHLHFGISPACGRGDWWVRRGVVSPYAFLIAWRRGRAESPVAAVAAWKRVHGCPASIAALPYGDG